MALPGLREAIVRRSQRGSPVLVEAENQARKQFSRISMAGVELDWEFRRVIRWAGRNRLREGERVGVVD